jgi:excisionase family DNA binding protein
MTKLTEYVKTAEASEILGVSQNTLRKWAEAGKIPMRRNPANGYRLFRQSDLLKLLTKLEPPHQPQGVSPRFLLTKLEPPHQPQGVSPRLPVLPDAW